MDPPSRYISKMSAQVQANLKVKKQRIVSSAFQKSEISDISEYLETKLSGLQTDLDYITTYRQGLHESHRSRDITLHELSTEQEALDHRFDPLFEQLEVLKRCRKSIEQDIEEQAHKVKKPKFDPTNLPTYDELETAFASAIFSKVMSASAKQTAKGFDQKAFRNSVWEYYGASKSDIQVWCHVIGRWFDAQATKAAHIVPMSLESQELAYCFGVGDAILSEPSNGITLYRTVEKALDNGSIVIVPVPPKKATDKTEWICILIDQTMANMTCYIDVKWKDLDGKQLEFLTPNRPARRFLYFRYMMTYLYWQKKQQLEWTSKIEAKGYVWATPGRYLRRSMLLCLARRLSDHYLPEVFYKTMFQDEPTSPNRSLIEEEALAGSIAQKLKMRWDSKGNSDEQDEQDDENNEE